MAEVIESLSIYMDSTIFRGDIYDLYLEGDVIEERDGKFCIVPTGAPRSDTIWIPRKALKRRHLNLNPDVDSNYDLWGVFEPTDAEASRIEAYQIWKKYED